MAQQAVVGRAQLYQDDIGVFLANYGGQEIDVTVTSPPYDLGKEYDGVSDDIGYSDWLDWQETWLRLLLEKTSDGGRLCLNVPLDTLKNGPKAVYADVKVSAEAAGWNIRNTIVWDEGNVSGTGYGSWGRPTAPNVVAPAEMIIVAYKGEKWRRGPEGRTWDLTPAEYKQWRLGVWDISNHGVKGHPAPFPEELVERLLKLYSFREDLIFDGFGGSGTVSRVCNRLGRDSIYVDQSAAYLELATGRVDVALGEPAPTTEGEDLRYPPRIIRGGIRDSQGQTWVNYNLDDAVNEAM